MATVPNQQISSGPRSQRPLIIGYHTRKNGRLSYAAIFQKAWTLVGEEIPNAIPCAAMFISGPRNAHININDQTAEELGVRQLIPTNPHPTGGEIIFHAAYIDLPWASVLSDQRSDAVFTRIDQMIAICARARADIVIHSGSRIFDPQSCRPVLARISSSLEKAAAASHSQRMPRIFLETMSHDARFASTNALNSIFDDRSVLWRDPGGTSSSSTDVGSNIGLCIDTAHIWAAGANIASREACATWFASLRSDIPFAMHLNDSKEVIGTHKDEHTMLGKGEIWSLEDGYVAALDWARTRRAPVILERNDDPEPEARADLALIARKLN